MKRFAKITGGSVMIVGGVLWFLPLLGFWMLPLGLGILGSELPAVKAFNTHLKRWALKRLGCSQEGSMKNE